MRIIDDEPDSSFEINIVPMIDVIFAILTFFILSTLFLNRSEGLPVNLPQAATGITQASETTVTVTITQQGQISVNRQVVTLEGLPAQILSIKGTKPQQIVVINADQVVAHGTVVAVMDRLRQIEGVRIAIATVKP